MHLDVYRSCSWREKRDVLNVFWRSDVETPSRIVEAALQYGYYAVVCLAVVVLELALCLVVAINHNSFVAGLVAAAEVFTIWSTWWALRRYRVLKTLYVARASDLNAP